MNYDDFFEPLANTKPYVKAAFEGFAGTGKTETAIRLGVGLKLRLRSTKPILVFDTEESMSRTKGLYRELGLDPAVDVRVRRSRSMADLARTMDACDEGYADILIIDSITHVWEDFQEAHKRNAKRVGNLQMDDWGIIKPAWKREFSERYVRGAFHCIFTGRAGFEYDTEINEKGKREFFKAGVKMKVEGETAYEPDILCLMSRFEKGVLDGDGDLVVWRELKVIKDRSRKIDGQTFRDPTYESFAPAIEELLSDPSALQRAREEDAATLIEVEENRRDWARTRDGVLEEIEAQLVKAHPGQSGVDKKSKILALEHAFGTAAWTFISKKKTIDELRAGLAKIRAWLAAYAPCEVCGGKGGQHETPDCPAGPTPAVPAPPPDEQRVPEPVVLVCVERGPTCSYTFIETPSGLRCSVHAAEADGQRVVGIAAPDEQRDPEVSPVKPFAVYAGVSKTGGEPAATMSLKIGTNLHKQAVTLLCMSISDRTKETFCVLPKNHAERCLPGSFEDVVAALDALDKLSSPAASVGAAATAGGNVLPPPAPLADPAPEPESPTSAPAAAGRTKRKSRGLGRNLPPQGLFLPPEET